MFPWETLITAAVGLAGIGGTLWQGKRSREAQTADLKASLDATAENLKLGIDAENKRARLADKRTAYATYLGTFNELLSTVALFGLHEAQRKDTESTNPLAIRVVQLRQDVANAASEVDLIAPPDIREPIRNLSDFLNSYATATNSSGLKAEISKNKNVDSLRSRLAQTMRADLGETD